MDSSEARIFETAVQYGVLFETVDDVRTPRIDKPDFTVGGLDFHLSARNIVHEMYTHALYVELSEASKKKLMNSFEIKLTSIRTNYILKFRPCWIANEPALFCFSDAEGYNYAIIVMEFRDVFPHRLRFVDADEAKKYFNDCKIVLKDDENKEIFVHKHILAYGSAFFQTLFFGDFKEKDRDEVEISDATEEEFLEYLFCVYPPPNRQFAFKRLDSRMADRFQNGQLIGLIEKFLLEKVEKTMDEKNQIFFMAGTYGMATLFRQMLEKMDKTGLKNLDKDKCCKFKNENMSLLLKRSLELM